MVGQVKVKHLFCIDCQDCRTRFDDISTCIRKGSHLDLVTGEVLERATEFCHIERNREGYFYCGEKAKFFKPIY